MIGRSIFVFIVTWLSLTVGNVLGDQKTLVDCATTGTAKMAGGGTIKCTVENKQ